MNAKKFMTNPFVIALIILQVLATLTYTVMLFVLKWPDDFSTYMIVSTIVYLGVTAFSFSVTAYIFHFYGFSNIEGKVWAFISAGMGLFFVGELIWAGLDLSGLEPFPSIADIAFLIGYGALGIGLLFKLHTTPVKLDFIRLGVIVAVILALLVPTVIFVAVPIIEDAGVEDTDGKPLSEAPEMVFSTVDGSAPSNPNYIASEGAKENVSLNATIRLELEGGTDLESAREYFMLLDEDGEEVEGEAVLDGTAIVFTPSANLTQGAKYTATLYIGYGWIEKLVCLAYPLLDFCLLAASLVIALYMGQAVSKGWYMIAAGFIFLAVADIGFASLEWQGYSIAYLDILWLLSYVLLALGALYQRELHKELLE